jgi:tight adherence protein B
MPEAMELLARSLRAGHTLQSTLELVSQEIPPPLGKEMRVTYEEQRLGLSISQALRRMADRVASQDLRYFVTAVLIQTETGGNLAELLETIGSLIRDRLKLKGKVQALTAEGRFSALVLIGLPLVTFGFLYLINPGYVMVLLTDPMGTKILTGGVFLVILGALVMKKMVTIKV